MHQVSERLKGDRSRKGEELLGREEEKADEYGGEADFYIRPWSRNRSALFSRSSMCFSRKSEVNEDQVNVNRISDSRVISCRCRCEHESERKIEGM